MPSTLRVDGGMAANDWAMQFLADALDRPVERPQVVETTALGAALLAGLGLGMFDSVEACAGSWRLERRFDPAMPDPERAERYAAWREAVEKVRSGTDRT